MNGINQQPETATWLSILPLREKDETFNKQQFLYHIKYHENINTQIDINHYQGLKYHRNFRDIK